MMKRFIVQITDELTNERTQFAAPATLQTLLNIYDPFQSQYDAFPLYCINWYREVMGRTATNEREPSLHPTVPLLSRVKLAG
jgi:hypothetical protein